MKRWMMALAVLLAALPAAGQNFALETNLVGYACLGTLNMEASYAPARHWTVNAGARYNPFSYGRGDSRVQLRQQAYSAGGRYWLWHVYSGWWFAGKIQYQEYNFGGIGSRTTREGDRAGAGLAVGYSHMLTPSLNISFGAGVWAGYDWYVKYACPVCGLTVDKGSTFFFLPDELMVSLSYIF